VRLFLAALVPAGLLVPTVLPGATRVAAAGRPAPAMADGAWALSYLADVQIAGPFPGGSRGTGEGTLTGTGVFEVTGGGIAGTHTAAGTAAATITVPGGQSGPATLNLALSGPVAGTTGRPVLQGDVRASGSVSVAAGGLVTAVPLDFDGALGDGTGAPLSRFSLDCDRVAGSWSVDLRGTGESPSPTLSISGPGTFVAVRTGQSDGTTPAYARQLSQLLADIDGFVGRVGTAPLDTAALDTIVSRSEVLASTLPVLDDCAPTTRVRTPAYSTLVGVEVARLLAAARAQVAHVTATDLVALVTMGYRTGAIGTGATWPGAVALERALRNELDRRGEEAAAVHDTATATMATVARRQFGVVKPARRPARPVRAVRGVATIRLSTPTRGRGDRPTLTWDPVAGATGYRVVLLDATRRPYWAWRGDTSSVVVGATPKAEPPAAGGPRVTRGSTWTVVALDATGRPIGLSAPRALSP